MVLEFNSISNRILKNIIRNQRIRKFVLTKYLKTFYEIKKCVKRFFIAPRLFKMCTHFTMTTLKNSMKNPDFMMFWKF